MNTPWPCSYCGNCEYDALSKDDPNSDAYCKKGLPMGESKCKEYAYWETEQQAIDYFGGIK